jgi:ubiquinone/menaquinone biosynthesis C-methylase UbiE
VQVPADILPFVDETFHLVFMTEVIHHLPTPAQSIAEIYRILKEGGSMCVVTQSHKQIDGRMTSRFFPASSSVDKERYPDIDVIEKYMLAAGFSSVTPKEYEFRPAKLGKDYLNTVENRGYSMLHKISREDYDRGVRDLRAAFDSGEELTYSAGYTFVWATK